MQKIQKPTIKLKCHLDQHDFNEIHQLMNLCIQKDGVALKLELEYKMSKARETSGEVNRMNEFMFYEDQTLIGYLGICQFGGEALEVNGMVDPEFRRNGVFTKLFAFAKDEWDQRATKEMLLLSDHTSHSGIEFIKSTGAQYDNSEYEMYLRSEPPEGSIRHNLTLRKATNNDAREVARQNAIFFGVATDDLTLTLPEDEAKRGMHIYIAEINHTMIGKVHLDVQESVGGIYGLGVLPEYRSKGYGREILMQAVEKLREKEIKEVMLQVSVGNNNALGLYQSCGFEETSTMDYYKLSKK